MRFYDPSADTVYVVFVSINSLRPNPLPRVFDKRQIIHNPERSNDEPYYCTMAKGNPEDVVYKFCSSRNTLWDFAIFDVERSPLCKLGPPSIMYGLSVAARDQTPATIEN